MTCHLQAAECRSVLCSRSSQPFARLALTGLATALTAYASPGTAQDRYFQVSASTQYDDNLRRRPDDQRSELPHNGSEIATFVSLDAGIAANFNLLTVRVDGNVGKRFFAYDNDLNSEEYRIGATADYQAQSGSVSLEAVSSRQNLGFTDPIFRGTNIRQLNRVIAEGDRRIIGNLRLAATARYSASSSPDPVLSRANNNSYGYTLGLAYVSPLGNRLTVGYSDNRTESTNERILVVDEAEIPYTGKATTRGVFGQIEYAPSVALAFDARVGYTWRDDRTILDADFQGITYNGSVTWQPLESVRIVAAANRSFSSNNELFANGVEATSYSLEGTAVAAGRLTLTSLIRHDERNFRFDLQDSVPALGPRTDRFWVYGAGARYMTGIGVAVGLNVNHVRIKDDAVSTTIKSNSVFLTLSRRFGF
ncbi:outer membrane beta-barrel protein [Croceibacterium ferulae]|uniref:outer membrane beta-barrel protein n=1 Tax=Croceibacterium ferulae TaxID=1854641 RepID=UPI000EB31100|nr:outer membrane beta-barrel protein [Croceibacterium ferulae]